MSKKKNNFEGKIIFISMIILLCVAASTLVFQQVTQRQSLFNEARDSVAKQWGSEQIIKGPLISYPYTETIENQGVQKTLEKTGYILPQELNILSEVTPEKRRRGIYDSIVYRSRLNISGTVVLGSEILDTIPKNARLDEARFIVALDDTRGIKEQFSLDWNGVERSFEPSASTNFFGTRNGISAPVTLDRTESEYSYSFPLVLQGVQNIQFTPLGANTQVATSSTWASPSFIGAFLPDTTTINDLGFDAVWTVSSFGRSYPQYWHGSDISSQSIIDSSFGVELFNEVDFYTQINRATKYAVLFIVLTFLTFFLFEIFSNIHIHPVQYLLIGFALVMFYVLLLSLSEHIGFLASYAVSSLATVALIGLYSSYVLKKNRDSFVVVSILTALYAYLYILLQMRDFSLLIGALFLFAVLGGIMFLTRNINWYQIGKESEKDN